MATINGGAGNDSIDGTTSADSLSGNDGSDTIFGDAGNDTIKGGSGNDSLDGWAGDDSIEGNEGDDTILGYDGRDTIDGGDGHDSIDGENDDDTLRGGFGDDTIEGGSGDDSIEGGEGSDFLYGESGADTIDGGAGQDWVDGGSGNDSLSGGGDTDTVIGRAGDDTLHGGDGADTVSGHEGDDALHGDAGDDSLYGGSGDDYFDGGTGTDFYFMDRNAGGGNNVTSQTDRDVVRFEPGMGNDTAFDFHGEEDYVYIGAVPESDVIVTQLDSDTWRLNFVGNSADSLTLNFASGTEPDSEGDLRNQLLTEDEYTPPENGSPGSFSVACLTPWARILTPSGLKPVGDLVASDRVVTADHGVQRILAVSCTTVTPAQMSAQVALRPVCIAAGSLGDGLPWRKMHVSRQHAFAAFGGAALIRAAHLVEPLGLARIQTNRPNPISYVHLMLERHALVQVEGLWVESYFHSCDANPDARISQLAVFAPFARHIRRCRPLLRRPDLRGRSIDPASIGRIFTQSAPRIRPAEAAASAPAGLRP